jgi:hypothetical protein
LQKFYKKHFCLFVLPLLVCFTVAFLVPFFMAILFSFTNYKTIEIWHFVGFQNYVQAFGPGTTFWYSLGITVLFAIVSSVIVNVFAFALAVLLSKGLKGSNFFRSVFFMPNLVGGIVLGYIWSLMIGSVLNLFHKNIASGFSYGFWGLIIMTCWQQVGYMMRSGAPDSLDRMVATSYGHLASQLLARNDTGRMVALHGGKYTTVPVNMVVAGKKCVDVPSFYDIENYRPHIKDFLGVPMFLS